MTLFHDLCATYQNTPEWHGEKFDELYWRVQATPYLRDHRDWVERHEWGMNDRPHHAMWESIVEIMPNDFKFVEIGCYRGQVLSLVGLIAQRMNKQRRIIGVSPFAGTSDSVNTYNRELDYMSDIRHIFDMFKVDISLFFPVKGYSQEPYIVETVNGFSPLDLLYIDGGHEYDAVRQDIINYAPMVKDGGILVMDDSSCFLNMPPFSQDKGYNRCWPGNEEVSRAVRDYLDTNEQWVHRFAIGHNRVFQKVLQ